MIQILAVVCARNEELHIKRCLDAFVDDGIDVILIDNDSEDRTAVIARDYLGHGLLSIRRQPWRGAFDLSEQLALKKAVVENTDHDWIIHADADEWLRPCPNETSLANAIRQVDAEGFNCIDFDEMVFVPKAEDDFAHDGYVREMTTYYFFQPNHPRLMRAWRRDLDADNLSTGGHVIRAANIRLYPRNFILRHYIALSRAHAAKKYVGRRYADTDLAKGWHAKRRAIAAADLTLSQSPYLKQLPLWNSQYFDRSTPAPTHFWRWQQPSHPVE
jgi:glycosyltransferase involved in cell wall biosynthesis